MKIIINGITFTVTNRGPIIEVKPTMYPTPDKLTIGLIRVFHSNNCERYYGPRGGIQDHSQRRFRPNGALKTWKTRPENFRLPIKFGHKGPYDYITQDNADSFHDEDNCPLAYLPETRVGMQTLLDLAHSALKLPPDTKVHSLTIRRARDTYEGIKYSLLDAEYDKLGEGQLDG